MRFPAALALVARLLAAAQALEEYSTNAICRQNNCINPLFPGINDLSLLETATWQCQSNHHVQQYMQFCGPVVNYKVAVPSPNKSASLQEMVQQQEKAAVTMYVYHLAGMNLEAVRDYRHPERSTDPCIAAIWTMVCNTYFPKAEAGCQAGEETSYLRPCKNVCGSYLQACDVRCCDESTMCVFKRSVSLLDGSTVTQTGYSDELGPSASCTGGTDWRSGARRTLGGLAPGTMLAGLLALLLPLLGDDRVPTGPAAVAPRRSSTTRSGGLALAPALALLALCLQGCDPIGHATSAWEEKPSYLLNFQFIPTKAKTHMQYEGRPDARTGLSSCDVPDLPKEQQCSGNGICKPWDPNATRFAAMYFCECDRDWADPECRTRRKSQAKAYLLSLFTGYLGFDRFYLGEWFTGIGKLATLGGLGFWWLIDIARIGSSPVYADQFRLAADLPHWAYVMGTTLFFALIGFWIFGVVAASREKKKQMAKMMLQAEEEFLATRSAAAYINPEDRLGMPVVSSWRMPVPAPGSTYGTMVPPEVRMSSYNNPYSTYSCYTAAERLHGSAYPAGGAPAGRPPAPPAPPGGAAA